MNVTEIALALVNMVQVVALAWIAYRLQVAQMTVKRLNGDVEQLRELAAGAQKPQEPF